MARKSDLAELTRRIKEIETRLREITSGARQANDPVTRPLRLELRVAIAKRDLIRAERRQSKHLLKQAQLNLQLAEREQSDAAAPGLFPDRPASSAN